MSIYGQWGSPLLYGLMADSDCGKTFDEVNTWRDRGLYLGETGSLSKVAASMGVKIRIKQTSRLTETKKVLVQFKKRYGDVAPEDRPIWAIVEDDASLKLQADKSFLWKKIPGTGRGSFDRWDALQNLVSDFARAQRSAGVHLHCSFHHDRGRDAEIMDGKRVEARKGGAATPGPSLARILTHHFDVLVFAAPDEERWPWQVSIQGRQPNDEEHTKDRHSYYRALRPINTRETLLHLGYTLPPIPSWEEEATARIAALAQASVTPEERDNAGLKAKLHKPFKKLAERYGKSPAYLALYNGVCRAEIRQVDFYTDIFNTSDGF